MGEELCFLVGFYGREGSFTLFKAKAAVSRLLKMSSPLSHYNTFLLLRKVKSVINPKLYSKATTT